MWPSVSEASGSESGELKQRQVSKVYLGRDRPAFPAILLEIYSGTQVLLSNAR